MRLAVVVCVIVPSGIDMVMSIIMPVAVKVPLTVLSSFCGFVHDILYENWPPLWTMSVIWQTLLGSAGISNDLLPETSLAARQRCMVCAGMLGMPAMFILMVYSY